ncbi:MAG: Hpt domain-containing protein, partial [Clostridiales bacterium]
MLDHLKQSFLEETKELLNQLEESLLELENDSSNAELISRVFRILHTIKGSAGMFDFDDISKFTHDIENVFDLIRNDEIKVDKNIVTLTLSAKDSIEKLLNKSCGLNDAETQGIVEAFRKIISDFDKDAFTNSSSSVQADGIINTNAEETSGLATYFIQFRPVQNILQNGTNPLLLLQELQGLGECLLGLVTDQIPKFSGLDPEKCYVYWNILLRTEKNIDAIKDVFIFVEDDCDLIISILEDDIVAGLKNPEEHIHDIARILSENPSNILEQLKSLLKGNNKPSQVEKVKPAPGPKAEKTGEAESKANIKVNSEKLDYLVNLVGELVTVQARLSQTASLKNDPELLSISEEVERLTCELRDNTLNLRMVPIGATFNRFKRLVRDLSQELGKKVDLFTEGDETELDKNVIDKLNDPLVHLI